MSSPYTTLLLRGGTKEDHLTGNGVGFIGEAREVTVDTSDFRLRVHDGITIGGIPTLTEGDEIFASNIIFKDGMSLQEKFDNGDLSGGSDEGGNGEETPNAAPQILAIDIKAKYSNGSAIISYFAHDPEGEKLSHKISVNNGVSFSDITPTGENPFTYTIEGLSVGQNLCAVQVSDSHISETKYFIVDIPSENIDTPPTIDHLAVSEIAYNGFKITYRVTDNEGDDIQSHKLSLNNGFEYKDIFPTVVNGSYECNVRNLTPNTTYHCRLKVAANGLDSLTYGVTVLTSSL